MTLFLWSCYLSNFGFLSKASVAFKPWRVLVNAFVFDRQGPPVSAGSSPRLLFSSTGDGENVDPR